VEPVEDAEQVFLTDIKCILSGKSAKAAMFYITDYITKMDVKTHGMLSLMSKVVAKMPPSNKDKSVSDQAKTLLHKCLSQFTKQQQIHAQQAVRYLCGHGDNISSHATIPMLSGVLIFHVKSLHGNFGVPMNDIEDNDVSDTTEEMCICVQLDHEGNMFECNQIHDYLFQADTLVEMNYNDYMWCV
jgi:hypothetical protein